MRAIQLLMQRAERLHRRYRNEGWRVYVADVSRRTFGHALSQTWNRQPLTSAAVGPRSPNHHRHRPPAMVFVAVLSLTSTIGYRFYNEPKLDVGTAAPQTIRAPFNASVEDPKTTEEKRREARTGAVPVLALDVAVNQRVQQALDQALKQGTELRRMAGTFPFVPTISLSLPTQIYLRQAEEWEWRAVLEAVEPPTVNNSGLESSTDPSLNEWLNPSNPPLNAAQQQAIAELRSYRQTIPTEDFTAFVEVIAKSRWSYPIALAALSNTITSDSEALYNATLFNLSDAEWESAQANIRQVVTRILAQGISPGLPKAILQNAVKVQVRGVVPEPAVAIAINLLPKVLEPNLTRDPEQTKLRAEQAAQEVKPVFVTVQQDEVIVKEGQVITQANFVLLDYFRLSRREINWLGLLGFGGLMTGAVGLVWVVERRFHPGLRQRDHLLLLVLTLSAPLLGIFGISSTSLPAIGLLVGSFYGSALSVAVVGLLAALVPLGLEVSWSYWLASTVGGLLGGLIAGRLRSREELALLGGVVGLTQGVAYLILTLILNAASGPVWYLVLSGAMLHGLAGVAWSVVALGLSPYLEHLFDLVTPIRLAELSNPNRPLLKRLASDAPGTFQHTLFVSTLAEAAARALSCNVELVRAGTLYHDIGKMHDPLGFIENQMGGPNKHDTINDPWKSAQLIKKHVSAGLVMARKCRLPKAIQAFIPEHQGTMLIAYFYHQAQQQAKQESTCTVDECDFRYDGPVPQSRETGIVMLADSCEAALRSLKDASSEEALSMINKILRARWQDNQLVHSGLSREEMNQIAEVFVQVWQQFNHQRIAYPKAVLSAK
ncbi:HDIG domain-containing protein [Trichocoleus desertorum AS-A10]|uniref:HD family phosphohydrolase n=1 Tax=Trichocoleus desertorum TaxID=1481672 RepID=UPI00329732B0